MQTLMLDILAYSHSVINKIIRTNRHNNHIVNRYNTNQLQHLAQHELIAALSGANE